MVGHLIKMSASVGAWDPTTGSYFYISFRNYPLKRGKNLP